MVGAGFLFALVAVAWSEVKRQEAEQDRNDAAYGPAVMEVLKKIYAGQFSFRVETDGTRLFGVRPSLGPAELRTIRERRESDSLELAVEELQRLADAASEKPDARCLAIRTRLFGSTGAGEGGLPGLPDLSNV